MSTAPTDQPHDTPHPDQHIRYEVADRVATVTLDRPDRRNALDPAMQEHYAALLRRADADPEVRAIVVTGSGTTFCPGADLDVLAKVSDSGPPQPPTDTPPPGIVAAFLHTPVVAAINGGCAGLGLVMACSADVRFAAAGARLSTAFVRRGLVAEYGLARLLPQLVGRGRALDLLLSGRTFTAEQAHTYGLVEEVVPATDVGGTAHAYAAELATHSAPRSMATIKRQVRTEADLPLEQAAAEAAALMVESLRGPDLAEGVASWTERRTPEFPPFTGAADPVDGAPDAS